MKFLDRINDDIKSAMRAREKQRLDALRAVKSAILLALTEKNAADEIAEEDAIKIVKRLLKQRAESAQLYSEQNRKDLADVELAQAEYLKVYLPEQLSEEQIAQQIDAIVEEVGASGMKDMGRVMGLATQAFAGKADNKLVSQIVRQRLS